MIKHFLRQRGFSLDDIIVWDGIITRLNCVLTFIKEPEDVRFADKEEIEKYFKNELI